MRILFVAAFLFVSLSGFAQKAQFKDITLQWKQNWVKKGQNDTVLRLDYQKSSAKVQVHYLGKVDNETASRGMVSLFQSENMKPELFRSAKQEKKKIGKLDVMLFEWEDVLVLDSQNSSMITSYQLYLLEKKGNKYYILTVEYFIKEKNNSVKAELNKLVSTLK